MYELLPTHIDCQLIKVPYYPLNIQSAYIHSLAQRRSSIIGNCHVRCIDPTTSPCMVKITRSVHGAPQLPYMRHVQPGLRGVTSPMFRSTHTSQNGWRQSITDSGRNDNRALVRFIHNVAKINKVYFLIGGKKCHYNTRGKHT